MCLLRAATARPVVMGVCAPRDAESLPMALRCETCVGRGRAAQVVINDTPCAIWGQDYSKHYAIWVDSNADSGNDLTQASVRRRACVCVWGGGLWVCVAAPLCPPLCLSHFLFKFSVSSCSANYTVTVAV